MLSPELSSGGLSGEGIDVEPMGAEAPALHLPRKGSFVVTEQPVQKTMPPQSEMHTAENTQQTRSASPETEAEGDEQSTHPLSESEQRIRGNNESTQAEPEA